MKNLRRIDLNLLIAFDALMREKNVTKAADAIAMSQPAMSNALSRLRDIFEDQVLVRSSGSMHPTPKALKLADPIHRILRNIEYVLSEEESFDPRNSSRSFAIATTDYVEAVLLPPLSKALTSAGSNISLSVRPLNIETTATDVEEGSIDCVMAHLPAIPNAGRKKRILTEEMVCAVRTDHPLVKGNLDLNTYISLQHLLISPTGTGASMMDTVLQAQGLSRNIVMRVPHFLVAPMIIAKSDLICTMPKRVAEPFAEAGWLKLLPPPLACPNFEIDLLWHKRFDADPGQAWLRDLIVDVSASL